MGKIITVVKPHAFMWAYRDVDFVDIPIVGDNRKACPFDTFVSSSSSDSFDLREQEFSLM